MMDITAWLKNNALLIATLLAPAGALSFSAGYFAFIGFSFMPVFSLQEHLVFGLIGVTWFISWLILSSVLYIITIPVYLITNNYAINPRMRQIIFVLIFIVWTIILEYLLLFVLFGADFINISLLIADQNILFLAELERIELLFLYFFLIFITWDAIRKGRNSANGLLVISFCIMFLHGLHYATKSFIPITMPEVVLKDQRHRALVRFGYQYSLLLDERNNSIISIKTEEISQVCNIPSLIKLTSLLFRPFAFYTMESEDAWVSECNM